MLWLQSFAEFDCIALFDPDLLTFDKASKQKLGNSVPAIFDGEYYEFPSGCFVFYECEGKLIFIANGNKFVLDDDTVIDVSGNKKNRILKVQKNGQIVYAASYENTIPTFENDPTPFIEDEHFDFGLFMSNLSKDPARRARIAAYKQEKRQRLS